MPSTLRKPRRDEKPRLFLVPGVLMLLVGFGILLRCSVGDRMDAAQALMIPLGFATAAIGAMVLTRSLIAVFFLFIYAVTALILILSHQGFASPTVLPFVALVILCLPMARYARR